MVGRWCAVRAEGLQRKPKEEESKNYFTCFIYLLIYLFNLDDRFLTFHYLAFPPYPCYFFFSLSVFFLLIFVVKVKSLSRQEAARFLGQHTLTLTLTLTLTCSLILTLSSHSSSPLLPLLPSSLFPPPPCLQSAVQTC